MTRVCIYLTAMPGHRPWLAVATGVLVWVSPPLLSRPGWPLALAEPSLSAASKTLSSLFEHFRHRLPADPVPVMAACCGLACTAHALRPCQHVAATGERLPHGIMHGTVNDIECPCRERRERNSDRPFAAGIYCVLIQLLATSSPLHRQMPQHTVDRQPCWMHSFLQSVQSSVRRAQASC